MDGFSPEFSEQWIDSQGLSSGPAIARDDEAAASALQEALEALADRVNAARCIY